MIPIQTKLLKTYLKRLTNLNSRNKSLVLSSLPSEQFLDIHDLDFLDSKSSFEVICQLIAQKNIVKLCELADPRFEKVNEVSKKIRKIARTEQFIAEERGAQDLYVGWPFIRGKFIDGTVIHAPLVFFPVTLEQTEKYWQLRRRPEPSMLNRSFLLAFSHFCQINVSDELLETNLDEFDKDALNFRTELYNLLKDSPIKLNFNQDLFQNKLSWFDAQKIPDLELLERNGELKLYPEAVLGIFPQAGSFLAPDYEVLIEQFRETQPLLPSGDELLQIHSPITNFELTASSIQPVKESETFTVFRQDATQELALQKIKQGQSLVIQGPPGSGKSQLIANLISDFTARGKRVLLVCQKRVALDVVYERLKSVGVSDFVALIHDFKNDRAALYKQISKQIDEVETFKSQNYTLDAVLLERQFLQASRAIDQDVATLEEFKKALFDESICGLSAKELYLTSDADAPQIDLQNQFKSLKFNQLTTFENKLKSFLQYDKLIPNTHFWHERVNFANFGFEELNQIKKVIVEIPSYVKSTENWQQLATMPQVGQSLKLVLEEVNQLDENAWRISKQIDDKISAWWSKINKQLEQYQQLGILGDECTSEDLKLIGTRLDKLIEARQSLLKWPFYNDKTFFKILTAKYDLSMDFYDLIKLKEKLANRIGWENDIADIETKLNLSLLKGVPSQTNAAFEQLKQDFSKVQKFDLTIRQSAILIQDIFKNYDGLTAFRKEIERMKNLSDEAILKYQNWRKFLTDNQINQIANSESTATISQMLSNDFDVLVETDKIKESFTTLEWQVVEKLLGLENPLSCFQNSLRLTWLQYIEEQNPILRGVSSLKISQLEENLQQNILLKQTLSQEILRLKLREQTYQELEFNRLKNRVTFRELYHQTTKKRKIWSVRKLLENHAEEIFKLVPCWMTSPEAASAIFPLTEDLFDLVIFDEASQCYSEYGIPALFRAKQFVIAGDSKQLTPTDLYRIRLEVENEDENPDSEIDSLLDLATQYIQQATLQGHYRSQTPDLISFSNQHFYQNKLQLLPHFEHINRHEPAIKYIKVDGEWKNNTNRTEAEKVWELVHKISKNNPEKSIGIVTFNYQQQLLIQEIQSENVETLGAKSLFIKNIENVQGDERDIIVFSIGYAPDAKGKVKAQFGSLNAQGGENRLNVAITRAREAIYLVTSILPHQLEVENTLHEGPKLFKKYLEYALLVSENEFVPNIQPSPKFSADWFLKTKIVSHNPQLTTHNSQLTTHNSQLTTHNSHLTSQILGTDIAIKNGDKYESVILTDDDLYYESISAKASHAYLPLQLNEKSWPFKRLWSREWWRKAVNNL